LVVYIFDLALVWFRNPLKNVNLIDLVAQSFWVLTMIVCGPDTISSYA